MTDIPLWAQIVIGSGVCGSVASYVLSPIKARQEIRKLEIAYRQKLNDNFIQTTREHRDGLYIPLNKSLSRLDDSYQTYKRKKGVLTSIRKGKVTKGLQPLRPDENAAELQSLRAMYRTATEGALKEFIQVYGAFNKLMEEITEDGRDTYLLKEFDERLRSFAHFLKAASEAWIYISSTALGTAPLTGERIYRDFPRASSWTLRHVGIRQRPGPRTPPSLRFDPRNRSDLVP